MAESRIGILGATSLVGECLLPMLCRSGYVVSAFSRKSPLPSVHDISWHWVDEEKWPRPYLWVCLAPIWVLPEYFDRLIKSGARRIVVLSSTSRFTKDDSSDEAEREISRRLAKGEARLRDWAELNGIEWVILRPTLIYGRGRDRNIAAIARFIHRFGFFPTVGNAFGLRQPIHAEDVAGACIAALESSAAANRSYNISGGETLSYREMVNRVFFALHRRPRLVAIPLPAFRAATACLRFFPRCRHWSAAMAERMSRDLVFDHADAARDLKFSPRGFRLAGEDVPISDRDERDDLKSISP